MNKIKNIFYKIINPPTIILVEVLYSTEEDNLLKYKGKLILPKNKYFKEMIHNHFETEIKISLTDEGGGRSYISDSKTNLYEMVRISLEQKLNIKITAISLLKACTN